MFGPTVVENTHKWKHQRRPHSEKRVPPFKRTPVRNQGIGILLKLRFPNERYRFYLDLPCYCKHPRPTVIGCLAKYRCDWRIHFSDESAWPECHQNP
mgnify:CR=1 FL=1